MCETKPNLGETFGLGRSGTCPTGRGNYDQSQFWRRWLRADAWAWAHFGCSRVVMGAKITIKANFHSRIRPPRLRLGCGHTSAAWGRKLRSKPIFTWYEQVKAYSTKLDTLRLWRGCQKFEIAIAQPQTQAGVPVLQGPSEVFRIVDDLAASSHETLPRNQFLLHWNQLPLADAWGCGSSGQ
jgi:hypothetical protein